MNDESRDNLAEIKEIQKKYEIGFLVATEEAAPELAAILKKYDLQITNEGSLRRIRLAYAIKKETSAVFGFFQFTGAPENIKRLEQDLRVNPLVIRSLIITLPKPSKVRESTGKPLTPRPQGTRTAPETKPAPTLSNEALEKKIEEILQ